ncbi:MAG: carbohydrate ABC transporter permease, partial [Caldilineaceae bacterium]|nr:carbohydrate ABC transporter permease [Caldilineaceae bacterium]
MSVNESVQISSYAADNRAGMLANRWTPRLLFFILALFSFAMFYPFLWLIFSSFKTGADIVRIPVTLLPERWTLSAYQMVLDPERANLPIAYVNSILVTTGTVLTVLITSSMGGFVFARLDFPGRDYLFYFVLATTMVPFLTLLIPLYIVMRELNLLNSLWGVWVPGIFSSFGIFLCRQFVYGVPRELYDAAKIDGSGDFAIYRNIILPLTKPVLSALAIFTFLGSFNAYLWPLVVLNDEDKLTLPLVIARMANRFGGTDYQAVMAGSVLVSIPPLLVFLFFQR